MGCDESVNRPKVGTKEGLRVACLQYAPVFQDRAASMAKADAMLEQISSGSAAFDLIILPEMAFTGYCFKSREDIVPFVEPS